MDDENDQPADRDAANAGVEERRRVKDVEDFHRRLLICPHLGAAWQREEKRVENRTEVRSIRAELGCVV